LLHGNGIGQKIQTHIPIFPEEVFSGMVSSRMNRREFLKESFRIAGSALLLGGIPLLSDAKAGRSKVIDSFHSAPDELIRLLEIALRRGGNHADIFVEQTASRKLRLVKGKPVHSERHLVEGLGIRVFHDDHTDFSWCESFEKRAARRTARELSRTIHSDKRSSNPKSLPGRPAVDAGVLVSRKRLDNTSIADIFAALSALRETGFKASNLLKDISFDYHDEIRRIIVANSNGIYITDTQPLIDLHIECTAAKKSSAGVFKQRISHRGGFDLMVNPLLEKNLFETAARSVESLAAKPLESSRLQVVFLPQASARLTECLMHFLIKTPENELQALRFPSGLTLTDSGRIVNGRGSSHFDDEGAQTSETRLVSGGAVAGTLNRRPNARFPRKYLTGNARRCSFKNEPVASPTNSILEFTDTLTRHPADELDDGLLVMAAEPVQNPEHHNRIELRVTAGHRIRNGRRVHPVKDVVITEQLPDLFQRIQIAGGSIDFVASTFNTCNIPVSFGAPALGFSDLSVTQK
jgi:TldD protein